MQIINAGITMEDIDLLFESDLPGKVRLKSASHLWNATKNKIVSGPEVAAMAGYNNQVNANYFERNKFSEVD